MSAPASVFLPKSTDGPGTTSIRSTSSVGRRSKLISSAVGSLTRTPSRNTLTPCGTPVTEVAWNPRSEMSGWYEFPCSSESDRPGTWPASASGKLGRPDRCRSPAWITCTPAGTLDGGSGNCGRRPITTISSDASTLFGAAAGDGPSCCARAPVGAAAHSRQAAATSARPPIARPPRPARPRSANVRALKSIAPPYRRRLARRCRVREAGLVSGCFRRQQSRVALQETHAGIPAQHRVLVAGRAQRLRLLVPLQRLEEPARGAARVGASLELGLDPPLADDARVIGALVVAADAVHHPVRLGDDAVRAAGELVGDGEEQHRQDVLVVRDGAEDVAADAVRFLGLAQQAVAIGLGDGPGDGALAERLELEHDGPLFSSRRGRCGTAAAADRRSRPPRVP